MPDRRRSVPAAAFLAALFFTSSLPAEVTTWETTGAGSWGDPANWTAGIPTVTGTAIIDNGATVQLPAGTDAVANGIQIGTTAGASGSLELAGGTILLGGTDTPATGTPAVVSLGTVEGGSGSLTITSGSWTAFKTFVGDGGSGTMTVNGGQVAIGDLAVGELASGTGSVLITGGTVTALLSNIGQAGTGTLRMEGGEANIFGLTVGFEAGSSGSVVVTGGTMSLSLPIVPVGAFIGGNGSGSLELDGGVIHNIATLFVANGDTSTSGTITVNGGLLDRGDGGPLGVGGVIYLGGAGGAVGTMIITGGTVSQFMTILGNGAGSVGKATISGGTWLNDSALNVGAAGSGTLEINGGFVQNGNMAIGGDGVDRGTGSLVMTSGTLITVLQGIAGTGQMMIGARGTGTVEMSGGTMAADNLGIGFGDGGIGTATITGGAVAVSGSSLVGYGAGTGTLNIGGGSVNTGVTGIGTGVSQGTVNVTGGEWITSGTLSIGLSGTGTVTLISGTASADSVVLGGQLPGGDEETYPSRGTLNIGSFDGTTTGGVLLTGSVTFGGTTGKINFNQTNTVAFGADISGAGSVNQRGSGTTILTGDLTHTGGTVISQGTLQIGDGGSGGSGGSIGGDITDNGTLAFDRDTLSYGGLISGLGSVVQSGSGTTVLTGSNSYSGGTVLKGGLLTAGDNGAFGTGLITLSGGTLGGSGDTVLANHIKVTADAGFKAGGALLDSLTLEGNVDLSGSERTFTAVTPPALSSITFAGAISNDDGGGLTFRREGSGAIFFSLSGTASNTYTGVTTVEEGASLFLEKSEGATAIAGGLRIATGGMAVVKSGGQIADTARVEVEGTGILQLGSAAAANEQIGSLYGDGTVTLNGGNHVGVLTVGEGEFSGTITGGTTSGAGLVKTGTGTLILSGSNSYRGTLGIEGGIVRVGADENIGSGGITFRGGALEATGSFTTNRVVNLSTGGGTLLVADDETLTLGSQVTELLGTQTLTVGGTDHGGTLVFTGTAAHNGVTTVAGGTLALNGLFSGTSAVHVASGATLAGSGTIAGSLEILGGGVLSAGNSPGTLTVGALTLNATSASDFELGSASDLVAVTGDLTLDGILNLSDSGGFANTRYTLFTYDGELTNHYFELNTVPTGWNRAQFLVDTATAGEVHLVVDNTVTVQHWDGAATGANDADGTVGGGDGTWTDSATAANWTNANGSLNNAWEGVVGVFGGTAGTVSVADAVAASQLQFETDGYTLSDGGGSIALTGSAGEIWTKADVSARVETELTGSALLKSGSGTLVLSASNSHAGTTIQTGTLKTENAHALGSGPVQIGAGGTLATSGTLEIGSLTWDGGGTIALAPAPASGDLIAISGTLAKGNDSGAFTFALDSTGLQVNQAYTLLTFGANAGFDNTDFSAASLFGLDAVFALNGNRLTIEYAGASTGPLLQNSAPVYTPTDAKFVVSGTAQTGGLAESNTVDTLLFEEGGALEVHNTLTVTSGSFSAARGSATLTGDEVATPGNFTKGGSGVLLSSASITVGGAAAIHEGGLVVDGSFAATGGLTVSSGATLGGSGTIDGNVVNHGTVSPGNSPGTLNIVGDYAQPADGTFLLEIAGKSDHDRLVVSGAATLDGTLEVLPYGGYSLRFGQRFTFVKAAEVMGAFDTIHLPKGFRGRVLQKDESAALLVAPQSYTQLARTPNQKAVATALDHYIEAAGGDRAKVSLALDELEGSGYADAFAQISPAFYESLLSIAIEQSNAQGQRLQQRFGAVRLGGRGFSQMGIDAPVLSQPAGGKEIRAGKDIMVATPENRWGIWIEGNGLFAKSSSVADLANSRFDSGGFLLGADYRWNEALVTGLYAGTQKTSARYERGSRTEIDAARFGGYAAFDSGNGFYANAAVGGGPSSYTVRRTIDFGSVERTARSKPDGGELSALLGGGYDWKAGGFTFGPVASAQYTYARIGSFTEKGAESLNLRLDDQSLGSLRSTLGARIAYAWKLGSNLIITPEARLTWQHEFLENAHTLAATLDAGNGPAFGYRTSTPQRDTLYTGAGVNMQIGNRWSATLYYNANLANDDFRSHMISGGINVKF